MARVEFYLDGNRIATDTTAPWSYGWNTATTYNGTHNIHVIAYDAAGNRNGFRVTVTVAN